MPRRRKKAQELTTEQALRRLFPKEARKELRKEARKARKKGKGE
jgi:hypothetical protein